MGNCLSCGSPPEGGVERVSKASTPVRVAHVIAEDGSGPPPLALSPQAPQEALQAVRTLVRQAIHVSQGSLLRPVQRQPEEQQQQQQQQQALAVLAGPEQEEEEDAWHDALEDLRLEEVLARWDEDQATTLERLDKAMQLLQDMGLAQLAAPAGAAAAPPPPGAAPEEGASLAGSLGAVQAGLDSIFRSLHTPHGARAEALLAEARAAVAEHRALGAEHALRALCEVAGCTMAELREHEALLGVDVCEVERDAEAVRAMLQDLASDEGWMVSRDDGLRVLYKHEKGGTGHSLKFSAVLDHPAEHVLALCNEFDLIKTWNKFSTDCLKVWQKDIFECVVYGAQWMPRPFKEFYSLIRARGYDLADEEARCLLVSLEDASLAALPPSAAPLPPKTAKRRLCNVRRGSCIAIRPLPAAEGSGGGGGGGRPRTQGSLLVHVDPHIPLLPAFIINFVLGVLAPYIYAQIQQVLTQCFQDPSGVYSTRIRDQPELYGRLRRRLRQFSRKLGLGYSSGSEGEAPGGGRAGEAGAETGAGAKAGAPCGPSQQQQLGQQQHQGQQGQQQVRRLGVWDTFDEADFHDALEAHGEPHHQ